MKKTLFVAFMAGLIIGQLPIPVAKADRIPFLVDRGDDAKSYKDLLRKVIGLMEEIRALDQQTADNTFAIREMMRAK